MERLGYAFFRRDCPEVARDLVGKVLCHRLDGEVRRLRITETECYCGEEDTACHAHKGRTARTNVMYSPGGWKMHSWSSAMPDSCSMMTTAENGPRMISIAT